MAVKNGKRGGVAGAVALKDNDEFKRVLELRREGLSFPAIAAIINRDESTCRKWVTRYMAQHIAPAVDAFREQEMQHIEEVRGHLLEIIRGRHPVINAGTVISWTAEMDENGNPTGRNVRVEDMGPRLQAAEKLIKLADRASKLMGADRKTESAKDPPKDPVSKDDLKDALLEVMRGAGIKALSRDVVDVEPRDAAPKP